MSDGPTFGKEEKRMSEFSLETVYNVYCDRDGRKISVGPDSDSLGLIEVIDHESKTRIVLEPKMAELLAGAIYKAVSDAAKPIMESA